MQADVLKIKNLMASPNKSLSTQAALSISSSGYFKAKLDIYVRDLPAYVEHASEIQNAIEFLTNFSHLYTESAQMFKKYLRKISIWRECLRKGTTDVIEEVMLQKLKEVGKAIVQEKDGTQAGSFIEVLAESMIVFPHEVEVLQLQQDVASIVTMHCQTTACKDLLGICKTIEQQASKWTFAELTSHIQLFMEKMHGVAPQYVEPELKKVWREDLIPCGVRAFVKAVVESLGSGDGEKDLDLAIVPLWLTKLEVLMVDDDLSKLKACCDHALAWVRSRREAVQKSLDKLQTLALEEASRVKLIAKLLELQGQSENVIAMGCCSGFEKLVAEEQQAKKDVCSALLSDLTGLAEKKREQSKQFLGEALDAWGKGKGEAKSFADLMQIAKASVLPLDPNRVASVLVELEEVCP